MQTPNNNQIPDAEKLMSDVGELVANSRTAHFALGVIDIMGVICVELISRNLIDAQEVKTLCRQRADVAHANGTSARALAAEFFAAKLEEMAKVKREVAANLMSLAEISRTEN
jgi:hypothetical protein